MRSERIEKRPYGSGSFREKNGSDYYVFRANGKQIWRKIGRVGALGRTAKEAKAREIRAAYVPPKDGESITYKQAGDQHLNWLRDVKDRSPATIEAYESSMRVHFEDWHDRDIALITQDDVERKQAALRRVGYPKSVNNWIGNAKAIFNFATRKGWIQASPAEHVENLKVKRTKGILFLDTSQLEKLCDAIPDDYLGPMENAMYRLDFESGLRMGELLALHWEDLDYNAERIHVMRSNSGRGEDGPTKSGKPRSVPMTRNVRDLFDEHFKRSQYRAPTDRVFCHPETGRLYDRSKLRKRYKMALLKAGIGPFKDILRKDGHLETVSEQTFHSLRRSYGTALAMGGAKAIEIKENMGHTRIDQTEKYMGYAPGLDEAERIGAMFEALRLAAATN
jgi:integrase